MEFIGVDPASASRIPVPNLNLSPEMLCKNYPLEFLMQPIIPLLSLPTSEEPSFCFSIPWLKEACLGISKTVQKPTLQIVGAGVVATGVAYCAWKISKKWSDMIFINDEDQEGEVGSRQNDKVSDHDPETEHLDAEVARIMSTIIEENTISTSCSSFRKTASCSSFVTDRLSQDTLCSCATEVGKPLKELQSRIDQVMHKVDVVISSLKVIEDNISPRKEGQESTGGDQDHITIAANIAASPRKAGTGPKKTTPQGLTSGHMQVDQIMREESKFHQAATNGLRYLHEVLKHGSPEKPIESGLGTGDKKENFADIHQRIKDLESRVDTIKNKGHENKLVISEPALSSGCSDNWDKSSSVSIISEDNPDLVIVHSNNLSPPRNLPITVTSLLPTGSHFETSTSPSEGSNNRSPLKHLKRNPRLRTYNFTQFPPIEEDPLSWAENFTKDKTIKERKERSPLMKTTNITTKPKREYKLVTKEYSDEKADSKDIVEPCKKHFHEIKRQGTWPILDYNQHENSKSQCSFYQNYSKIDKPFTSGFKTSENSSFKMVKSAITPTTNSAQCFDLNTSGATITELSSEMASETLQHKPPNSPLREFTRKDGLQLRSNDNSLNTSSPDKASADPATISLPTIVDGSGCETTELSNGGIVSHHKGETMQQLDNDQSCSISETAENDGNEWMVPKHKLMTGDADAPPIKMPGGDSKVQKQSSVDDTEVTKEERHKTVQETARAKSVPGSAHRPDKQSRIMSPFKKLTRKNNDFNVKYINNKGSDEKREATPQGEKEDEWIVIVPTDKS